MFNVSIRECFSALNMSIVCIRNTARSKSIPLLCTHVDPYKFSTVHPPSTTVDLFLFYHVWGPAWIMFLLKWHLIECLVTYDFTLHLMIRDHTTTWCWRCVGTAFGHFLLGSHNSMVTALSACVKWPSGRPLRSSRDGSSNLACPCTCLLSMLNNECFKLLENGDASQFIFRFTQSIQKCEKTSVTQESSCIQTLFNL
jgi:hypothetical protein